MTCDVYYDKTVLLMHMDGINNGTVFPDNSQYNETNILAVFFGVTSTTHPQFGTASLFTTASSGGARVIYNNAIDPMPARYDIRDGIDFAFEASVWKAAADPSQAGCIFSFNGYVETNVTHAQLVIAQTTGRAQCTFKTQDGLTTIVQLNGTTNLCNSTWHKLAVTRTGTTYNLYVDGVRQATATAAGTVGFTYGQLCFGMTGVGISNTDQLISGWIDELRYTVGFARYTGASYTPDVAAYGDTLCPPDGSFYGKFVNTGQAFRAIQSSNLGNAKPRVFQPFENETIKVPQ